MAMQTTETEIESFWESHPCGDSLVGGLSKYRDVDEFLAAYDRYRYSTESHIPRCLDRIDFAGKRVLEIGLGQGSESEQIIRRGARWTGIDLTRESIERVRQRLALRGLPFEDLRQGSVLELPFPDGRFDLVFSHGVLHHVPGIDRAQREIRRVLAPGGELVVMLYARWSLNYLLSISLLRRAGLLALHALGAAPGGKIGEHLARAREMGVLRYLRMRNFIHKNTDGPSNPYSRVYDVRAVRRAFPCFRVVRAYKRFMHAPPLPVRGLPLERLLGWHLWVHLRAR
ncbi:MAG: class I SAM-dependent methyltransferase [Planctomycetes bacterium]|nr:class I SAM-dependent methyltransferase [Planctomycetota bacterium]